MTVAQLKKVTLAGKRKQKEATLQRLQDLGCMHLVPLSEAPREPEKAASRGAGDAYKALRFLTPFEGERRQVQRSADFDVRAFVDRVLDLKQKVRTVGDRRDFLADRIETLRPWGEIAFPGAAATGDQLLWFYELPIRKRAALDALDLPWQIISSDTRTLYVALIAPDEPAVGIVPVPRSHLGSQPLSELEQQLIEAEIELEQLHAERVGLTRYLTLLRANLSAAETRAELNYATEQTHDEEALFAVQGWVPVHALDAVSVHAEAQGLAMMVEEPAWDETPPTLLVQPDRQAAGVDLAMFYQVPNYRDWDPTGILMFSFSIFFAMIVADAGYGVIMAGLLALGWARLGHSMRARAWRRLGLIIALATIAYGVIIGSYFGAPPPSGSLLAPLAVLSLNDFDTMMRVSVVVGAAHLIAAIAIHGWVHRHKRSVIAQLGWIAAIAGGLGLWLSNQSGPVAGAGAGLIGGGLIAIVLFTSDRPVKRPLDWAWRLFDGLKALSGAMGAFGDILSYMRLFALGLASASLAMTFNDLAGQIRSSIPGLGILLAVMLLLVGHALNFALGLLSGVVHGLRLNYIEFFKWGLPEEGVAFRPLARKEVKE